ncbi:hypothetical protein JTE90_001366 [Oedothorax gibbosus]|uniref:Uncharacterized protein n=1 Tax=Oedothorax gibbosus TaxID=931172 RepID=A0AAV6VHC1_9ARAC|nr:hypothetical protein JTE90_001366 [Oedothorax gibbosus]
MMGEIWQFGTKPRRPNATMTRRPSNSLFAFALLVLSGLVIQQAEAGIGGLLGLGGNKGFGGKKTSEMLVAASILASLISKHKESQSNNKPRAPMMPMPMPPYGGYAAGSSPYGSYGAAGYGGGLGSSLYGGYPGLASAYGGGFASPSAGGYGGYGGYPSY